MLTQYGILNLWTYVAGAVVIVLLPGPNSLYVLATGTRQGVRAGYQAAAGIFLGDSVLMTLTAAGAASVLHLLPVLFMAIKLAGALYLGYLGYQLLRSAWRPGPAQVHRISSRASRPFRRALLLSLLNPKAILFFLSFFVQFVDPAYAHPALPFVILASILQCLSVLYLSALIFGGARLAAALRRRQGLARTGSALVGLLFLGFAGMMAFES